MASQSVEHPPFDFRDPVDLDHALRIGRAWIELRRGAGSSALRDYFFGREDALEQGQMDALDLLARRDRTMKGLAERLHIDPSSATRAVHRIVKEGLAERYDSPEDGRVVMVRITTEGRRRHCAVAERRELAIGRILGSFAPDERAQLAELMGRLIHAIDDVVASLPDARDDEDGGEDGDGDDADDRVGAGERAGNGGGDGPG